VSDNRLTSFSDLPNFALQQRIDDTISYTCIYFYILNITQRRKVF
jgi:hypothetical protein